MRAPLALLGFRVLSKEGPLEWEVAAKQLPGRPKLIYVDMAKAGPPHKLNVYIGDGVILGVETDAYLRGIRWGSPPKINRSD